MRGLAALLAVLVAFGVAACGSRPASAPSVKGDVVALAASKTNEAGTYKADITGTIEVAGQSVQMSGSGAFDSAQKQGQMSYTMTMAGQDVDVDMVLDFPVVYMRFPPEIAPLPGSKSWVKMDFEKLGREQGVDLGQLVQAGQSDPSQGLDYLRGASDVQAVGAEDVRSVPTTHYTGVVDLRALGVKDPELKKQLDQLVERSGIASIPVEVWIDDQGLVRRMKQTVEGNRSGLQMNMTMTTELYDFGTDVSVEKPPADQVVDFGQLMGQS